MSNKTQCILHQDTEKIEKEISIEIKRSAQFQPLVDAIQAAGIEVTTNQVGALIYKGGLDTFLQQQALDRSPELNSLPMNQEAKLRAVDVAKVFPNLKAITDAYNQARSVPPQTKAAIYQFDIVNGKLELSKAAKQNIIDRNTVYGSDEALELQKRMEGILTSIQQLYDDTGVNFRNDKALIGAAFGDPNAWRINPHFVARIASGKEAPAYL